MPAQTSKVITVKEKEGLDGKKHQNSVKDFVLIAYNAGMTLLWFGFAICFFVEWKQHGTDKVWTHPRQFLKYSIKFLEICQAGQWVNVLLAIIGLSKTALASEIGQLWARSIFCYISIQYTDESKGPFIFLAFLAFSVAEPIRYPYYLLKMVGADETAIGRFFGHLRYNMFIVFYPLGAFCDLAAGYFSAETMAQNGYYSIKMPNTLNFSIWYPWFITRLLPFLYLTTFPMNYGYLMAQRKKYYAPPEKIANEKKTN